MVNNLVGTPLSNYDLEHLLQDINKEMGTKKAINIMTVPQIIKNPQSFKNKLLKDGYCILFIDNPDGGEVGHWIVSFWSNNTLSLFDSYGMHPDKLDKKLTRFLKQNFNKVRYNTTQYQKYGDNVATCGRYAMLVTGLRKLIGNNMTIEDVDKFLKGYKKKSGKGYDKIVADLINSQI